MKLQLKGVPSYARSMIDYCKSIKGVNKVSHKIDSKKNSETQTKTITLYGEQFELSEIQPLLETEYTRICIEYFNNNYEDIKKHLNNELKGIHLKQDIMNEIKESDFKPNT